MGSNSNYVVLEITLISAQGLKELSAAKHGRSMQTYAVAWVDPSIKLRTCVARVGGGNPSWNDKLLFKVSSDFLRSETSGVSVEIFAVGVLRDTLLGTVRLLVSNFVRLLGTAILLKTPASASFSAVQVRRPSGRFHGVLNVAVSVLASSDAPAMTGVSAISVRDLIGKSLNSKTQRSLKKSVSMIRISGENMLGDSDDESDGCDSTSSSASSSAAAITALKEWNRASPEVGRRNLVRSSSEGGARLLCGLGGLSPMKSPCVGSFVLNQSFNGEN
ncbi:hypothetical protein PTKIN_Ptkin07bG0298200 [Pterospermum kingtungense]